MRHSHLLLLQLISIGKLLLVASGQDHVQKYNYAPDDNGHYQISTYDIDTHKLVCDQITYDHEHLDQNSVSNLNSISNYMCCGDRQTSVNSTIDKKAKYPRYYIKPNTHEWMLSVRDHGPKSETLSLIEHYVPLQIWRVIKNATMHVVRKQLKRMQHRLQETFPYIIYNIYHL